MTNALHSPRTIGRLHGGLGNQLFQIAATRHAADVRGTVAVYHDCTTPGFNATDLLRTEFPPVSSTEMQKQLAWTRRLDRLGVLGRAFERVGPSRLAIVRQSEEQVFQASVTSWESTLGRDLYLDGYFQHPSFFANVRELATEIVETVPSEQIGIGDGATVVAFRRGDYVRLGWDLPLSYYRSALERLTGVTGPVWVVADDEVFSELASEWLRSTGFRVEAPPSLDTTATERDLRLLMLADRVVMANSTFCWWGVMAGDLIPRAENRKVYMPQPWIAKYNAVELGRDSWITIDAERRVR